MKQRVSDGHNDRLSFAAGFDARIPMEEIPIDRIRDSFDSYIRICRLHTESTEAKMMV